jgi:hypothetical protein
MRTERYNQIVSNVLDGYLNRGFFCALSKLSESPKLTAYTVVWHRNRRLLLEIDYESRTITVENLLPGLTLESPMGRDLVAFLGEFRSRRMPRHRRIDARIGAVHCIEGEGGVSLSLAMRGTNYEAGVRKIVQIVHELFLDFLLSGPYRQYQIDQLGLDPDAMWLG